MKKKMCRWIFKKELNEAYTELNNSYCREVRRVEAAMEHNEKKYGLMKRIFSLFPTAEIIGLEENGNKEELIVVLHDNSILLFGERYQGICGLPSCFCACVIISKKLTILLYLVRIWKYTKRSSFTCRIGSCLSANPSSMIISVIAYRHKQKVRYTIVVTFQILMMNYITFWQRS